MSDGLIGHPLFSPGYVEETVRPAIARGAALARLLIEHAAPSPSGT